MKRFLRLSLFAGLLAAAQSLFADGFIIIDEAHWQTPARPQQSGFVRVYAPLEVTYHRVNVKIDGQIATTSVDEEFYNPNGQRLEGTYLFPIPKGGQIDKFSMEIGGQQVQAELLAADKARGIYEDIVRKLKDPALLEYAGRDVFKVRVFPIEPNGRKRITLSYSQVLTSDAGLIAYTYPLNTEKFSARPVHDVSIRVDLQNKASLKTIYSSTHNVDIRRDGPNRATIGYEATDVKPDTDFTLYFAPQPDEVGLNLLTYRNPGEDGYFLLLASPGIDTKDSKILPKDVVFVLDTSGSMAGPKIKQARNALQYCVDSLNDNDRFQIIRFSTEVEPLFDHLVDASSANRDKATSFIKGLSASGATAIDDALKQALAARPADSARPFSIIFLTDGMPTIGVTDDDQILKNVDRADAGRTRIFCFGIGGDVNTHLLDRLTEQTRGASQYVLPEEDIELKVSSFFDKVRAPVLANPSLTFGNGIRATKLYPTALPDLFKGEQVVLAGRYSGNGNAAITLQGLVNGETRKFTYEAKFPAESSDHEFIPRLWATRRVGYLLDEIRLHGENNELKDEVTELARKYGIVTPYTAYLIVEDEAKRGVASNLRSFQNFDRDIPAQRAAAQSWSSLNTDVSGIGAIGGAQLNDSMKNMAAAPSANFGSSSIGGYVGGRGGRGGGGAAGGGFGGGGGGGMSINALTQRATQAAQNGGTLSSTAAGSFSSNASAAPDRLMQYAQQSQFVAGRNFFQNGNQWTDSEVQNNQSAAHKKIQINSAEYFDFLVKNPKALPWVALGLNVQFVLNGTVYEIYE